MPASVMGQIHWRRAVQVKRRDRLQAAHAAAVVLVQSEAEGGAMHALRVAREHGRPRFAFAARDGDPFAGNALAIAEGAATIPWNFASAGAALPAFDAPA